MRRMIKAAALAVLLAVQALPVLAVTADEQLADPRLEARARGLSAQLRCLVCQNESIDESNADLAKDLRVLIRDQISAGKSDGEIMDYLVSRYGEFVLLKPVFSARNLVLWVTPFAVLLLAGFGAWHSRRDRAVAEEALTPEEQAKLKDLIGS
jgi:cytochrome c-type biogenesis protein CcmH